MLRIAIVLYFALSLPYGVTKLSGDEVHFATIPYLILGGDYTLTALRDGQYGRALEIAGKSYALAWRYYVRPIDAGETAASDLTRYDTTHRATPERRHPFVFTPDYFVTHRKTGKPLFSFLLNVPALAATRLLPQSLIHYQREYIYHPAFLVPRAICWLAGLGCLLMLHRIVRERWGVAAAGRAAICFALLPVTVLWSADLHQDVPMTLLLLVFAYYLWRGQTLRAAVAWGLAFGTKNQAIFALAPLVAEAIWLAADAGTWRERFLRALPPLKIFAVVLAVGIIVSTPFGHPWANIKEIFQTSEEGFDQEIQSPSRLFFWNPIWWGMGLLAFLGLRMIDDARDWFDRYWVFFLILPGFLTFFSNTRIYMLLPAVAILAGSYFRPKTLYFTVGGLALLCFFGMKSPYITIRGVGYRDILRDYPVTIGDIEMLRGVGSIRAEEQNEWESERAKRRRKAAPNSNPDPSVPKP